MEAHSMVHKNRNATGGTPIDIDAKYPALSQLAREVNSNYSLERLGKMTPPTDNGKKLGLGNCCHLILRSHLIISDG